MSSHQLVQSAGQNDAVQVVIRADPKPKKEAPSSRNSGQPKPPAEHPLAKVQKNLSSMSHLIKDSYTELAKQQFDTSRADRYEQAYIQENNKLRQAVEAYNELGLQIEKLRDENTSYTQELIPEYDNLLHIREQENKNLKARNVDLEARNVDLEARNVEVKARNGELENEMNEMKEKQHSALVNAAERINAQNRKIDELKAMVEELTAINRQSPDQLQSPTTGKRQRPSELEHEMILEEEHADAEPKKSRKRRQVKPRGW